MFYKPPEQQRKESRFWSLLYVGLSFVTLVVLSLRNYFFGIAGGKLIERILSLTFEKIVHQEIKWFDDPANSSGAVGARLSTDASTVKSLVVLAVLPMVLMQGMVQMKFLKGFSADAK
ncbi:ABC transporter B family member 9-like, partial [Trifolium medium]|nr:ABC transporter B family member 9-like [Trifolium medium]